MYLGQSALISKCSNTSNKNPTNWLKSHDVCYLFSKYSGKGQFQSFSAVLFHYSKYLDFWSLYYHLFSVYKKIKVKKGLI